MNDSINSCFVRQRIGLTFNVTKYRLRLAKYHLLTTSNKGDSTMDQQNISLDLTRSGKIQRLEAPSTRNNDLLELIEELETTLGRPPQDAEVADALGITYEEFSGLVQDALVADQTFIPKSPEEAASFPALVARHLTRQEQHIIMLHYVEELEDSEIGMILGLDAFKVSQSLKTIKNRLSSINPKLFS